MEDTSLYYSTNPDYECSTTEPFVLKEIVKDNLFTDLQLEQAKVEFKI